LLLTWSFLTRTSSCSYRYTRHIYIAYIISHIIYTHHTYKTSYIAQHYIYQTSYTSYMHHTSYITHHITHHLHHRPTWCRTISHHKRSSISSWMLSERKGVREDDVLIRRQSHIYIVRKKSQFLIDITVRTAAWPSANVAITVLPIVCMTVRSTPMTSVAITVLPIVCMTVRTTPMTSVAITVLPIVCMTARTTPLTIAKCSYHSASYCVHDSSNTNRVVHGT
jgi:hypothetical protein